jgi:hypothetical protein
LLETGNNPAHTSFTLAATMVTPIEVTTTRLVLRQWRDADRAPFAALNADPQVMRYFPATQDRVASDAAIDRWSADLVQQGWSNWAVELRQSGAFIGFVGLSVPRRVLPFSPCVEIGWRLARTERLICFPRGPPPDQRLPTVRPRVSDLPSLARSPCRPCCPC